MLAQQLICINRNGFSIFCQSDLQSFDPLHWTSFLGKLCHYLYNTVHYEQKGYKFKAQAKICSFEGVTEFTPSSDNIYFKHKMCI